MSDQTLLPIRTILEYISTVDEFSQVFHMYQNIEEEQIVGSVVQILKPQFITVTIKHAHRKCVVLTDVFMVRP